MGIKKKRKNVAIEIKIYLKLKKLWMGIIYMIFIINKNQLLLILIVCTEQ